MTFPLIPRGRLIGLSFGTMRSLRRGTGSDVAGSRVYEVGDDVHAIDWAASARLSSARQTDEFVVREHHADEAPRVVVVCDRRPGMSFFGAPLPWLDKPAALRHAVDLIFQSTVRAGGFCGYVDDDGREAEPYWEPPRGPRRLWELKEERVDTLDFPAQPESLERALAHLGERRRSVSAGAFVFVLSDFIPPPAADVWQAAQHHRWDVIPVVIQDPVWEQSFPDVRGIVVPLRDPVTGRAVPVRLRRREIERLRRSHEERFARLLAGFDELGLDHVLVSAGDQVEVLASFLRWADARGARRAA